MSAKKHKRKQQLNEKLVILIGGGIILLIAVILLLTPTKPATRDKVVSTQTTVTEAPEQAETASESGETTEASMIDETSESAEVTATPESVTSVSGINRRCYVPEANEGLLPVFTKAVGCTEKIVAITVDDCFQINNLKKILQCCQENDAKITIFPIGKQLMRDSHQETFREAYAMGMEIEDHTYTHNGLYRCSDEILAKEIYMQNLAISYVLNVNYKCHFLRPKGGDASYDQRIHSYINQLGFYGVAKWSVSGSGTAVKDMAANLQPGTIFLFHTTDSDLEKLLQFIPYLKQQGYQMVTLNEMFGYPANETSPLTEPIDASAVEVPQLEPYDEVLVTLKKGKYLYAVKKLQDRLYELGYLDEPGDGCYGDGTAKAVKAFQKNAGLSVTGEADPDTQIAVYKDDAPHA